MSSAVLDTALRHGLLTPEQVERWRALRRPLEGDELVRALQAEGFLDPDEAETLRSLLGAPGNEDVAAATIARPAAALARDMSAAWSIATSSRTTWSWQAGLRQRPKSSGR